MTTKTHTRATIGALALFAMLALLLIGADGGIESPTPLSSTDGGDDARRDAAPLRTKWRSSPLTSGDRTAPAPLERPEDLLARLPTFTVEARTPVLEGRGNYPCSECHEGLDPDPRARALVEEHDEIALFHGAGRFWCLTCHDADDRDALRSLDGKPISFDQSFLLCGQCHFAAQRDFVGGAHGKRVGNWEGERVLTSCVACHDAHDPSTKLRTPAEIPLTRKAIHSRHAHGPVRSLVERATGGSDATR